MGTSTFPVRGGWRGLKDPDGNILALASDDQ
jgi:hypothetical protein